jgi:hydrogenase maturation protein HypF
MTSPVELAETKPKPAVLPLPRAVTMVLPLHRVVPTTLGVGAFLKNTLCLAEGRTARITPDAGDLDTIDAVRAFDAEAEALIAGAAEAPAAIAHDLHPDFHSTRFAQDRAATSGCPAVAVQHHHAHVASVMAEHGVETPTLGLALDGFGLGPGGESWGGELLLVDRDGYRRLGHLTPLKQPGGDKAAREPWRMAAAALSAMGRGDEIATHFQVFDGAPIIARMLEADINAPATTSCGRLFDAACGLLGVVPVASFEGEAPMALERLATAPRCESGAWHIADGVLDCRALLQRLIGRSAADGANLFHGSLSQALVEWAAGAADATGVRRVALAGGCFLNRVLRTRVADGLTARGIDVLEPLRLRPGDQAISLGQAWVAILQHG